MITQKYNKATKITFLGSVDKSDIIINTAKKLSITWQECDFSRY